MIAIARLGDPYRNLPLVAWQIAGAEFVSRSGSAAMGLLALYLYIKWGFNAVQAGWVVSLWGSGTIIGSFLGGWLCDQAGARKVLVLCHGILALLLFWIPLSSGFLSVAFLAFLIGTIDYTTRPTLSIVLLDNAAPDVRGRANALRRVGINLGGGMGTSIGGVILGLHPDSIFWLGSALSLCASIILFVIIPADLRKKSPLDALSAYTTMRGPWRDRAYLLLLLAGMATAFIFSQERAGYPLYLAQSYRLDTATIGLISAANGFLIVLFELPIIHLLRRIEYVKLCVLGSLLYGVGFGILPLWHSPLWAWLGLVLWTLGEILCSPASMALAQQKASKSLNPGSYMGLFTASLAIPSLLSPGLGGMIYAIDGGSILWAICFGLGILGAVLFWQSRDKVSIV